LPYLEQLKVSSESLFWQLLELLEIVEAPHLIELFQGIGVQSSFPDLLWQDLQAKNKLIKELRESFISLSLACRSCFIVEICS
jgi:hypothetical protein